MISAGPPLVPSMFRSLVYYLCYESFENFNHFVDEMKLSRINFTPSF